jgi:hypothetical protein
LRAGPEGAGAAGGPVGGGPDGPAGAGLVGVLVGTGITPITIPITVPARIMIPIPLTAMAFMAIQSQESPFGENIIIVTAFFVRLTRVFLGAV